MVERSRKVAARLANGVAYLMQKNKITVIDGTARLQGQGRIAVTGEDGQQLPEIEAKHIVIATGARAKVRLGLEPDGKLIWTYKEAMVPPSFPKSMLVVGSGPIGIEFASFYRALGAEVTVVEMLDRILPARGCGDLGARTQSLHQAGHGHPYEDRGGASRPSRRQRHGDASAA